MPQKENGEIVKLFKKIGIVAGGALAVIALATTILGFLTEPIYKGMKAEASVRFSADSLASSQMDRILRNQVLLVRFLTEDDPIQKQRIVNQIEESYEPRRYFHR